jgi:hypothetical protein
MASRLGCRVGPRLRPFRCARQTLTTYCDFLETRAQKNIVAQKVRSHPHRIATKLSEHCHVGKRSLFVQPILPTRMVRVTGWPLL